MGQPIRLETNEQIEITGDVPSEFAAILTPEALRFVADLQRRFGPVRERLLARRTELQVRLDHGLFPDFLSETRELRETDWKIAGIPAEIEDRRVEITGPVDRKMVINALNSGARIYMADFEDSHSPTWKGTIEGQLNLRDAVRRTIQFESPEGKSYRLKEKTAVLMVRPRGWHLEEKHMRVDGRPVSASIFDFGLFFFHNAEALLRAGSRPYFYLPKLESHQEAKLWNDVFVEAQNALDIPVGTIKATVLIETILAAFEMHEILYELKEHSAGLNCGRWDYIFSFIKKFRTRPEFVLPDRAQVTMTTHFLKSYSELLIQTCHRRGAHAMGGMAAQIPIKGNEKANEQAMEKVRADKLREVKAGHDGTWVAHPGLVELATKIFDDGMPGPNQIERLREDVNVGAQDLLAVPKGTITEDGLRTNINVGSLYLSSWLEGNGCVPLYHLMEDAATAEISRAQVWQWVHHGKVEASAVRKLLSEEPEGQAREIMERLCLEPRFADFLTLETYRYLR